MEKDEKEEKKRPKQVNFQVSEEDFAIMVMIGEVEDRSHTWLANKWFLKGMADWLKSKGVKDKRGGE